ncbi:hypothetical protein DPMN_152022 [Dreissena polymorpha]|uniref:Uncharacterized protein n=1 Tax=Dreissena polymorpha TaxID=45954 RepID=A0A9D4J7I9_DREPO|nr:hypothetical protein DPMN_152022 [Dreissena polymorpha]
MDSLAAVSVLPVQVLLQAVPMPVDLPAVLLLPAKSAAQFSEAHQEVDFSQDLLQVADSLAAVPVQVLLQAVPLSVDLQAAFLLPAQSAAQFQEAHQEADYSQDQLQVRDSLAAGSVLSVQVLLQAPPLQVDLQAVLPLPAQSTAKFPEAHQEADFFQDLLQVADSLAADQVLPVQVLLQAVHLSVAPLVLVEHLVAASAFPVAFLPVLNAEEAVKVKVKVQHHLHDVKLSVQ